MNYIMSSKASYKEKITEKFKNAFLFKSNLGEYEANKCSKELFSGLSMGHLFGLTLNTFIHMATLFLIISLFFFLYIANITEDALNGELVHNINANLPATLKKMNEKYNNTIYDVTRQLPYDKLTKIYSKKANINELNNQWLKKMVVLINVFLWTIVLLLTITSLVYAGKECRWNTAKEIFAIFGENLVVFICVGIVELLFFQLVARKYVPAPPSLLVGSLYTSIKDNIKPM